MGRGCVSVGVRAATPGGPFWGRVPVSLAGGAAPPEGSFWGPVFVSLGGHADVLPSLTSVLL